MQIKVTDEGLDVRTAESPDRALDFSFTASWERIFDGLYAVKEFVRFILPGGYTTPIRPRRRQEDPSTVH